MLAPAPDSPIAFRDGPGNLALGKVNRDDHLDLVVTSGGRASVLLGQGDGRFRVAPGSPMPLPGPASEMVLGEFNGDGNLDVAFAHHDSYGVMLFIGDGSGGLALASQSPVIMKEGRHPHTHGLHGGDLNGDGKTDLVSMNSDDHDVSVAFADGTGGFTRAAASFAVAPNPYPGALADLNDDGALDIVATSVARGAPAGPAGTLTVLIGDGRGDFRGGPVPVRTGAPGFVAVADVNGDRKPDLVATHLERSELTILAGDGKGGFEEAAASPFDLGHSAWQMAVADVNGDGKPDVAAAAGDGVRVMLGDGQGGFRPAPGSPFATGKGSWQLSAGDVNGDGKPDVITSDMEGRSVTILLAQ